MPTQVKYGNRIGRQGRLRIGCSAVIFDQPRQKVLLTRRTDNGLWCLPGGGMDPGESAAETCVREVLEETGLRVQVVRLIGVYTSPDWLVEYPDGERVQLVAMSFEAAPDNASLVPNQEVSEFGYFSPAEIQALEMMQNHTQRIQDAFSGQCEAFIR
jgi:8-oxo-dGTP pyrophosphatase MutT (NUDIX family)